MFRVELAIRFVGFRRTRDENMSTRVAYYVLSILCEMVKESSNNQNIGQYMCMLLFVF